MKLTSFSEVQVHEILNEEFYYYLGISTKQAQIQTNKTNKHFRN